MLDEEYVKSFISTIVKQGELGHKEDYYLLSDRSLRSLGEDIVGSLAATQCVVLFLSENYMDSLIWKYLLPKLNKVSDDIAVLLVYITSLPPDRDPTILELNRNKVQVIVLPSNPVNSLSQAEREQVWLRVHSSINEFRKSARNKVEDLVPDIEAAEFLVCWDPDVVAIEDYATLITALGDIVRSEGGIGVERIRQLGFGIPVNEGALV
jgi:hypothetical protein